MKHSSIDWSQLNKKALKYFGIKRIRPCQREIIESVMNHKNVLGLMPTGAGKSLCYQLPALFFKKTVIVVSPLISLMHDQTTKLEEAGVEATKFDSTLTASEEKEAVHDVKKGLAELVYVTPEQLENPERLKAFQKKGVSLVVIDEAHCVSQWGHDFRPAFLNIRKAIEQLGSPPVLAVTATATDQVQKDILEQLGIPKATVISCGIDRPNLVFNVYRTVNEDVKFQRCLQIIGESHGIGIVYVTTVKLANELHSRLLKAGLRAGKYHGKMPMKLRRESQEDFMHNRFDVIVATKAFGLGIDKPDVRFVIHYTFPDSVESYYQEAGRAGRDGKKATTALLYRLEDKKIHSFFLGGKYPTSQDAAHLYQTLLKMSDTPKKVVPIKELVEVSGICKKKAAVLLNYLEKEKIIQKKKGVRLLHTFETVEQFEKFLHHYDERTTQEKERIETIMRYGQTTECRMMFMRHYFGEEAGEICKKCDNCRGKFLTPNPLVQNTSIN